MTSFYHYASAWLKAFVVAPIAALLNRGVDGIIADFNRLDRKLDAFLDSQAVQRERLRTRRDILRKRIDNIWSDVAEVDRQIERAARVQAKLRDLTK